ncbi:AAA family ATPase, partial [Parageobacillus thermoglucosidasius]
SVILFDEIEKAHPEVFNILLQLLDDGRITDSQGRTVDFKNTVVIMTSNIGSHLLLEGVTEDGKIKEETREQVLQQLRAHFRPEFLNRIDDIVLFKPLTMNEIKGIVAKFARELAQRLSDRHISLSLTEKTKEYIAESGFDPVYGARPLRRFMQKQIETPLAKEIVAGRVKDYSTVVVDYQNGRIVIEVQ